MVRLFRTKSSKQEAVGAQLPCVTKFGMAALMPDAAQHLRFKTEEDELLPYYKDQACITRSDRIKILKAHHGRVEDRNLKDFLTQTKTIRGRTALKNALNDVDLFVLTSTELDAQGENGASSPMRFVAEIMQDLRMAVARLESLGFDVAIIATDHGFVYYGEMETGNKCGEPPGEWNLKKRRCLIGTGDSGMSQQKFATSSLGIPTDAPSFVVPSGLSMYRKGNGYFHEGLSLQESLIPRIELQFGKTDALASAKLEVALSRAKKSLTSLIVSVTLTGPDSPDMFSGAQKVAISATQGGEVVGSPTVGPGVDPGTNLVTLPDTPVKISLRLSEEAKEGTIIIKASDPDTDKTLDSLELNYSPLV